MIRYDVNISNQAEQDLRGIYEYIAFELFAPENAWAQIVRLEAAIEKLVIFCYERFQYTGFRGKSGNLCSEGRIIKKYRPEMEEIRIRFLQLNCHLWYI